MSDFVFKHFTIRQQLNAMKIGTDSVLLGCLLKTNNASHILDIGTGTGLLALMLAQRTEAIIDAVEIDEQAATEAGFNFKQSKWANRITLHHSSIQQFCEGNTAQFDLIVANPPYYPFAKHAAIHQANRSVARQTNSLSFDELIQCLLKLLSPQGSCWLILPIEEGTHFIELANNNGLHLQHCIYIKPKHHKASNRMVLQLGRICNVFAEQTFVVYEDDGTPTASYKNIAADFYIGKQFAIAGKESIH
ncbi:MAG: methyltransferase domain-containing protein [Bacteroidetes bacterium]|nr:MAG: methyltransferase domain-containing protein [Bacteroidota bacterium]